MERWIPPPPLCVAMATMGDGKRLISCAAVELGERERGEISFPINVSLMVCRFSALPVSISCYEGNNRRQKHPRLENNNDTASFCLTIQKRLVRCIFTRRHTGDERRLELIWRTTAPPTGRAAAARGQHSPASYLIYLLYI